MVIPNFEKKFLQNGTVKRSFGSHYSGNLIVKFMCDEKLKISIDKKFVYHQLKKQKKKN